VPVTWTTIAAVPIGWTLFGISSATVTQVAMLKIRSYRFSKWRHCGYQSDIFTATQQLLQLPKQNGSAQFSNRSLLHNLLLSRSQKVFVLRRSWLW